MKATSKLISVVLILAMCLSLFTVSAFADSSVIVGGAIEPNQAGGIPARNSWVGANRGTGAAVIEGDSYQGSIDAETVTAADAAQETPNVADQTAETVPAVVEVSTAAELIAAAAKGGEIRLLNDIAMNEGLTVAANAVIDLNGKVLSFVNEAAAKGMAITGMGATVKNGTVSAKGSVLSSNNGTVEVGFGSVASGVTLNNVNVRFNAPAEWTMFGQNVNLVYGTYNRDVSARFAGNDKIEVVEQSGVYTVRDKVESPEAAPAVSENADAVVTETEQTVAEATEEAGDEAEKTDAEAEETATETEGDSEVPEENKTEEGEQTDAEDQQAEVEVEGDDAKTEEETNAEGEDAAAEGEDAEAEGENPAAEGEDAQTDENALPESNEQQAAENPADDEPADETPVNVVEEEEKVLEEEVRTDIDAEEDETDVVTLTGTDPTTGAVVIVKGKNLPEGLTVVVKPLSLDTIDGLAEDERAVLALDISLVDAEGNEYEPKDDPNVGAVSVQIQHPSLGNLEEDETLALYHIVDEVAQTVGSAEQTGEDALSFATTSFSPFVAVAKTGNNTFFTGSDGEAHNKSVSIKNLTGDVYVIGTDQPLKFEISGGVVPESISIVDPDNVSSGNADIFKAGYLIYGNTSGNLDFNLFASDGSTIFDPNANAAKPNPDPIPDPLIVQVNTSALKYAPTGKWAVVFWLRDTKNETAQRVYMVQYITIVPKAEIKALAPVDAFGDFYFNKCSYDPLEIYLTAELDYLEIKEKATGKVVAEYYYATDKKHVKINTEKYPNKTFNYNEMIEVSDYVTDDLVGHEYVGGRTLKILPNLLRKLDFKDYEITVVQQNHNVPTAYYNWAKGIFNLTMQPGITVADGLNDYIKGKNVWIKFESCWPIDYDDNGKLMIYIGGQQISKDYYSISNDHQTLWIYRNILDQLRSNNSYTLTAQLWRLSPIDGHKETFYPASTSFNILAAGSTSYKSPKTGDNSNVALWAAVAVLSGGAVVALIPKKKKVKVSK